MVGVSESTLNLYDGNHVHDVDRVHRASLAPGEGLDYQNLRTANTLIAEIDKVVKNRGGEEPIELYEWIRRVISLASTDGVYGATNPFRDSAVLDAFWEWDKDLVSQLAGVPEIIIKEQVKRRDLVIEAFRHYMSNDHSDAAEVIHERERIFKRDGVPADDIARIQMSFNVALLPNTAPTAFWTIYDIISRPDLLRDIRHELETVAVDNQGGIVELDVAALKTRCPLLLSAHQETQRLRTINANIRQVMEETVLDGKYWLKKGSYVEIPNSPIHYHPEVWGKSAKEYNPRRFMDGDISIPRSALPTSYAFLAWGTAPTLCPARQFAATEILILTAMLVLQADIEPLRYDGDKWREPAHMKGQLVVILPPKETLMVQVKARSGWDGEWKLRMGGSRTRVPLASG